MTINVIVTGTSGSNTGTQVLKALLASRTQYKIVTTDINEINYGRYLTDHSYVVPYADSEEYLPKILDICRKEKIHAIIPGSEQELKVLSKKRRIFKAENIHLIINNADTIEIGMDKMKTVNFLKDNGFCYPDSMSIESDYSPERQAKKILSRLKLPLVLKPYQNSGGSNDVVIIQKKYDLLHHLKLLKESLNSRMMVQEYEGSPDEEYTVGVMSNARGLAFSSFALKRLINSTLTCKITETNLQKARIKDDYLVISSGISQGWVDDFKEVRSFAENVANALKSTGPLNIQCRKKERGIVVFEINPRFSGTTSVRAICGHNDPDMMIRSKIYNEDIGQVQYKKGLILRTLENTFLEGLKYNQRCKRSK